MQNVLEIILLIRENMVKKSKIHLEWNSVKIPNAFGIKSYRKERYDII